MVSPVKPEVDEASLRYQSRTKLAELSNDIASTGSLNKSKDKLLHATKIRLWLKALDLKEYLSREQREKIWYALIDISGIYDFPAAPVLDNVPRPNVLINQPGGGGGAGTGTVSLVGLSMPSGFTVTNSPITGVGTIIVSGAGASTDYIDGTGAIQPFPSSGVAEQMLTIGRNSTGSTLYKGTIVYISGSTGNRPNFVKAQANSEATSAGTFGVITADIANNSDGYACTIGTLHDLDTRAIATHPFTTDTLADGDTIYLSPTIAGYVTNVKPYAPEHVVYIGNVVRTHPTLGTIVYRIQNGYELKEIHDVAVTSATTGQTIRRNTSTNLWENQYDYSTISVTSNYTIAVSSIPTIVVLADTSTSGFTITLPTAISTKSTIVIKKTSASNILTISGTLGQTIDGGSTAQIKVQYASITLVSDGSNWQII